VFPSKTLIQGPQSAGHLTTLNFNQWNLACPFPANEIGQLEFVENLIMANNFNLTVRQLAHGPVLRTVLGYGCSMSSPQVVVLEDCFCPFSHRSTQRSHGSVYSQQTNRNCIMQLFVTCRSASALLSAHVFHAVAVVTCGRPVLPVVAQASC